MFMHVYPQNKYKEAGMQSLSHSVYSQLPETEEIKFAKAVADLQSEVRREENTKEGLKIKVVT